VQRFSKQSAARREAGCLFTEVPMSETSKKSVAELAEGFAFRLNWINERACAALVAGTVIIVWFGIVERYILSMGIIWAEELARYVMIWAALMAVPCCAYRREHISVDLLFCRLPRSWHKPGRLVLDCLGLLFFVFMLGYGLAMVEQGRTEYASIFGMTMFVPFMSVVVSSLLTIIQIAMTMLRDYYSGIRPMYDLDDMHTN
jgi:TRAP-type C4-dicarboxylate transport system permease small subunit